MALFTHRTKVLGGSRDLSRSCMCRHVSRPATSLLLRSFSCSRRAILSHCFAAWVLAISELAAYCRDFERDFSCHYSQVKLSMSPRNTNLACITVNTHVHFSHWLVLMLELSCVPGLQATHFATQLYRILYKWPSLGLLFGYDAGNWFIMFSWPLIHHKSIHFLQK